FLRGLRQTVERLFPAEQFTDQRAYVNCSVYGDGYYLHRDCAPHEAHVTALYYANLEWKPDWGGETIYYTDGEDAELAISPRPGRLVIARCAPPPADSIDLHDSLSVNLPTSYSRRVLDPSAGLGSIAAPASGGSCHAGS